MMNVEAWVAIGGLAVTVVGWFIRLERRLGATLTRAEHERICAERNSRVEKTLDDLGERTEVRHAENRDTLSEIKDLIERNHSDAVEGRHRAANQILTLVGQVALLEGRMQARGADR